MPIILGAGLAGLTCAYELIRRGIQVLVLEKEDYVGGLAASGEIDGMYYDYGPHRFHSKKKPIIDFLQKLMGDNLIFQKRRSEICLDGRFFIYPLDTGNILRNMSKRVLARCFFDYILGRVQALLGAHADGSFESWVTRRFGKMLYRIFFGTYTQKVLGLPPSQISEDWAKERVSLLDLWSVVSETVFGSKNPPRTYANHFYYPRRGGIGQIAEALRRKILETGSRILLNINVTHISCEQKGVSEEIVRSVMFEHNGIKHEEKVSCLLSTIPIISLPLLLQSPVFHAKGAVFKKMKFRALIFAYFVLNKGAFGDSQWIYLPEESFFSNRISEPKNFSADGFPENKTVICAEISCDHGDEKWNMDHAEIKERVLGDIERLISRKIGQGELLDYFCRKVEHCYPIYEIDYQDHVRVARELLASFKNLDCFGRNGSFKYNNMDDSIEMGLQVAKRFLNKNPES